MICKKVVVDVKFYVLMVRVVRVYLFYVSDIYLNSFNFVVKVDFKCIYVKYKIINRYGVVIKFIVYCIRNIGVI